MAALEKPRPLNVLVIGAGIAGLTAAIAFGKQGHHVVVLEKSKFNRETGAAIHIPPNCTVLLKWLDINPIDFGGTLLEEIRRYDHQGNLRYHKEFADIRQEWQAEWYLVHRVDLHNYLKRRALQTAILRTGCRIIGIDIEAAHPLVRLDDGQVFTCDLLLGADGLHSVMRNSIVPDSPHPAPVGKSCFRWLLPTSDLQHIDVTRKVVRSPGVFIEWAGVDRRLVAYPCSNNEVFNLCAFLPTIESGEVGEDWQATGNKAALIQGFSQFCPAVQEMAKRADEQLKVWELFDMRSLPHWVKGHAALLGDAAHPFQPYMGQGGAMAIEDAVSLATVLPLGTTLEEVPSRLKVYEQARRPRIDLVMEYTRMNGRDEDDSSARRITAAEMVQFMGMCFSHNEVANSTRLLEANQVKRC